MENKNYIVYKHTTPNGKVYIGITNQTPQRRWNNGSGYYRQKLFNNAIEKYGWENIKHEILFEGLTKDAAEQKEIELIALYKSNQREYGYNIAKGGATHESPSELTKQKISISNKGRIVSEETRKKISIGNKGKKKRPLTQEEKEQRRLAMTGRVLTEEWKKKIGASNKGKTRGKGRKLSEEHKQKLREIKPKHKVLQYSLDGVFINEYISTQEIERVLGIDHRLISKVCLGQRKQTHGYIWKYSEVA